MAVEHCYVGASPGRHDCFNTKSWSKKNDLDDLGKWRFRKMGVPHFMDGL